MKISAEQLLEILNEVCAELAHTKYSNFHSEIWLVNERGMRRILLETRKPIAEQFQQNFDKWLHSEVLPQVMQTGNYISNPQATDLIKQSNDLRRLEERFDRFEQLLTSKLSAPPAFETLTTTEIDYISVAQFASLMQSHKLQYKFNEKSMFKLLRDMRLCNLNNAPTEEALKLGVLKSVTLPVSTTRRNRAQTFVPYTGINTLVDMVKEYLRG
jgi:prophage antirepressor-like protein